MRNNSRWRAFGPGGNSACIRSQARYLAFDLRYLLAATLFFLSACAADETIDTVFDPCSPLTIVPGPQTRAQEIESIEAALVAWNEVLPTQIEVADPAADVPGISILFESGDTYYRAIYLDKRGEILMSRDRLDANDLPLAIAHELGHAFGLLHVPTEERASVMNVGNLEVSPNAADAFSVAQLWEACVDSER